MMISYRMIIIIICLFSYQKTITSIRVDRGGINIGETKYIFVDFISHFPFARKED